ncbi:MAG: gluconokinase [Limnochordaceae bacterium]|nr:gluconokinase [Limnochordaceae bacterium]
MAPPLFAAVDMGSSGVRSLVVDGDARPVGEAAVEVPVETAEPGQAEVSPDAIWGGVLGTLRRALEQARATRPGARLEGIGLSSALFTLLGVDAGGQPVTPVYTWMDRRAAPEVATYRHDPVARGLYRRTGCPLHALHPLAKVRWLRRTRPESFERAARWISAKEYVLSRWFGRYVVDVSIASSTGYFNILTHDWDDEALAFAGLRRSQLSDPVDAAFALTGMDPAIASYLGIDPATPVAAGAGDGMLAHVASGGTGLSVFSSTVGTSGAVRVLHDRPLLDPLQRTWCYCLDRQWWVAGGAINNGGVVLQWLRRLLVQGTSPDGNRGLSYQEFDRLAASVPPGSRGLVFVPLLTGERSPGWNDRASGVVAGLRIDHGPAEWARAAMEGVTYRMLQVYRALVELTGAEGELRASGGYTRSETWLQMQADVFGRPVTALELREASALGAAIAAMKAVGFIESWAAAERLVASGRRYRPDPDRHAVYRRGYDVFQKVYAAMEPLFDELAGLA